MLGTPLAGEDSKSARNSAAQRTAPSLELFQRGQDASTGSLRGFTGAFEGGFLHKAGDEGFAHGGSQAWTPGTFRSSRRDSGTASRSAINVNALLDDEDRRAGIGRMDGIHQANITASIGPHSVGHAILRSWGWSAETQLSDGKSQEDLYCLGDFWRNVGSLKHDQTGVGFERSRSERLVERRATALTYQAGDSSGDEFDVYDEKGKEEDGPVVMRTRETGPSDLPDEPWAGAPGFVRATHSPPRPAQHVAVSVPAEFVDSFKKHSFAEEDERGLPDDLIAEARRLAATSVRPPSPSLEAQHAAVETFLRSLGEESASRFAPAGSSSPSSLAEPATKRRRVPLEPGMCRRRVDRWQPRALLCKRLGVAHRVYDSAEAARSGSRVLPRADELSALARNTGEPAARENPAARRAPPELVRSVFQGDPPGISARGAGQPPRPAAAASAPLERRARAGDFF